MSVYIDVEASGRKIKELSRDKGYSAMDLQNSLGLESCQAVYKWFSGKGLPSIDNLLAIAHLFGVSMEDLIVSREVYV